MTLVILAAGMGSRFGGLKQIEPIGPNGEFIIDYSIYDAIKAGFNKVVFVIKEENYDIFRETVGKRVENKIEVAYAFQTLENIPTGYTLPDERVKPLGTAHALYSAMEMIDEPFALISADDFYGREPFFLLKESLLKKEFGIIGYNIGNTLTENGTVKRGVCFTLNGKLTNIVESKVKKVEGIIKGEPLDGSEPYIVDDKCYASMLMYGIQPEIFAFLKEDIKKFLDANKNDLNTCEYYLPNVLNDYAKETNTELKLIPTKAVWKGITYSSDLPELKKYIEEEIERGVYPVDLYD